MENEQQGYTPPTHARNPRGLLGITATRLDPTPSVAFTAYFGQGMSAPRTHLSLAVPLGISEKETAALLRRFADELENPKGGRQ